MGLAGVFPAMQPIICDAEAPVLSPCIPGSPSTGLTVESFEELNDLLFGMVVRQLYAADFIDLAHELQDIDRLDMPAIFRTFSGQLAKDAAYYGLCQSDVEYHRRGLDLLAKYPDVARNLKVRGLFDLLCLMWYNGEPDLSGELQQLAQDWPQLIRQYEHLLPCGVLEDRPIVEALEGMTGYWLPACGRGGCSECRHLSVLDGPRDYYGSPPSYEAIQLWVAEDARYEEVEPRRKTARRG